MEPLHPLSSIVPLPEFDLWGVPSTQTSFERISDAEYRPVTTVSSSSPIVFLFTTAQDEYVKCDEIYLSWNAQFTFQKKGDTVMTDNEATNCFFMGNAFHSMINQVEIELNSKSISSLPQYYAYRSFFETLLGFSKDARKSYLESSLWSDDFKTLITTDPDKKKSKIYNMMGRLHSDLGFQGRYMIGGTKFKIEISLNTPKFYLKLPKAIEVTLELSDVRLFIQKA